MSLTKLLLRFPLVLILFAAVLFIPAGSLEFWQGWAWIAVVFIPYLFFFTYLYKHDPQLLERRLQAKEEVGAQNLIKAGGALIFFSSLLLCGLDFRFGWSGTFLRPVPLWLTLLSQALIVSAFQLIFWVMRVNSFAARTIRVEPDQRVISTRPYRFVRHPMYFGVLLFSLATPLALGSFVPLPALALAIPILVLRLLNEEKTLRDELPGYIEYCQRTRFRLVPFVW